ncbi:hypothetical protein V8C35DRAFT_111225 [Trichoderma chlorosporum]
MSSRRPCPIYLDVVRAKPRVARVGVMVRLSRMAGASTPAMVLRWPAHNDGAHAYILIALLTCIWKFHLCQCPKELSGYSVVDKLVHASQLCYVKLVKEMV